MSKQLLFQGEIIKKDNELIRTKINIKSVEASRILASFIAQIRTDETELRENYTLNVADFLPNTSGRSYQKLDTCCDELVKATYDIKLTMENGAVETHRFPFFSHIAYSKGQIRCSFNFLMRHTLIQLKEHFTEINLLEYLVLSSVHSQRLFEILKSWAGLPECTIELEELYSMLNTAPSLKSNYHLFKTKVLEPCHKEINKKTNFFYEYEPIKKGSGKTSPVIAVRFIFSKIRALPIAEQKESEDLKKTRKETASLSAAALKCVLSKSQDCDEETNAKKICKYCKANNMGQWRLK